MEAAGQPAGRGRVGKCRRPRGRYRCGGTLPFPGRARRPRNVLLALHELPAEFDPGNITETRFWFGRTSPRAPI